MNSLRIESYMNELATMLETHQQQSKQEAAARAQLAMLDDAGQPEQAMQAANQVEAIKAVVASIELTIAKKTKRADIEAARKLYLDIATRIESADKLLQDWRRIEAQYELGVATNQIKPEDREKADVAVAAARTRYETQVELTGLVVPTTSDTLVIASSVQ